MSYDIFVIKFENGTEAAIDFAELQSVLNSYGQLIEHDDEWSFLSSAGELFDNAQLLGDQENGFFGINIQRPTTHPQLSQLIFDLLAIPNTCFFGSDMNFLQSRSDMTSDLPDVFQQAFPDGPRIITNANSVWPSDFSG